MEKQHPSGGSNRPLLLALCLTLAAYGGASVLGVPQHGTELVVQGLAQAAPDHNSQATSGHGHSDPPPEASGAHATPPPLWMVGPFALLLAGIAVLPLVPGIAEWWDSNFNRFLVASGLGILTLLYYLILHEHPVHGHFPTAYLAAFNPEGANYGVTLAVLANAILNEYIPFITLLFTLYTISGGIRIEGDLRAKPSTNTLFLAVGALLASFIGTTGAAMLLIRPLLETNRERRHVVHTVVFFIFVVCNCGGCLLPLGDPPLFLGYLLGVPFLWTARLWPEWLFVNGMLLLIYYLWDVLWAYPREQPADVVRDASQTRRLRFLGLWPNAVLLVGVIASVGLLDSSKPLPGTTWHPWLYLREAAQLGLVLLSLVLTDERIRHFNRFNYHAIIEVAVLFLGIFVCMQAPLQILNVYGPQLGLNSPLGFFWATGGLSSVLDNAPTYVVFFAAARSLGGTDTVAGVQETLLAGVSLGAVFLGSMTYIGNGPNFMVKAIAEKSGVPMPSFFGYMLCSCLVLLPLFALTSWLFL